MSSDPAERAAERIREEAVAVQRHSPFQPSCMVVYDKGKATAIIREEYGRCVIDDVEEIPPEMVNEYYAVITSPCTRPGCKEPFTHRHATVEGVKP